jgi:putative tryptophan/tyrosine transport system substrate-binding protein
MPHRWSRRRVVQGAGAMGLGLLAGCGRLPGPAQPAPPHVPRIALIVRAPVTGGPEHVMAFRQGLRDHGYLDGQNVVIEVREPEGGRPAEIVEFFTALARQPVDVIVTATTADARYASQATDTVPIVMARSGVDPVAAGLISSLARPGGNLTGLTAISQELSGKRLELLKETVPSTARLAVLWSANNPDKAIEFREVETAAQALGLAVLSLGVRPPSFDFEGALESGLRDGADALIVLEDAITLSQAPRIVEFATMNHMPTTFEGRFWAEAGGLMSVGVSLSDMFRRAAAFVDKILKGAKPADLPVERPMRFEFIINRRTAQALGLIIPHHVLLQATEVIQ